MWSPRYFAKRFFPGRYFSPSAYEPATEATGHSTQAQQISRGYTRKKAGAGLRGYAYELPYVIENLVVLLFKGSGRTQNQPQRVAATGVVSAVASGGSTQGASVAAAVGLVRASSGSVQGAQASGGEGINLENEDWLLLVA